MSLPNVSATAIAVSALFAMFGGGEGTRARLTRLRRPLIKLVAMAESVPKLRALRLPKANMRAGLGWGPMMRKHFASDKMIEGVGAPDEAGNSQEAIATGSIEYSSFDR